MVARIGEMKECERVTKKVIGELELKLKIMRISKRVGSLEGRSVWICNIRQLRE